MIYNEPLQERGLMIYILHRNILHLLETKFAFLNFQI